MTKFDWKIFGISVLMTFGLLLACNAFVKWVANTPIDTSGMIKYSVNQYDSNDKLINSFPEVVIISQQENDTLIYDVESNRNIHLLSGRLEFSELDTDYSEGRK